MNPIFESSLLIILVVAILREEVLRVNFFSHYYVLILVAILTFAFICLSFAQHFKFKNLQKVRLWTLFLVAFTIYSFSLFENINIRKERGDDSVHDGAVQIEYATRQFLMGKNPYIISYDEAFANRESRSQAVVYKSFVYSPVSFLINIPSYLVTSLFFVSDLRFTLFTLFFLTALIGSFVVKEKIIFLVTFLFNPLFATFLIYGANEVIALFFLFMFAFFIAKRKFDFSTIMLSLAVGAKLIALPLVPLYFIYLYLKSPISKNFQFSIFNSQFQIKRFLLKQLSIFALITAVIYLPFAIGNFGEFFSDLFLTHLEGGISQYSIVGFVGVPQLLSKLDLISDYSSFPFYLMMIMAGIFALWPIYRLIEKFGSVSTLLISYFLYFCAIFIFSRIFQTTFLAFLSQILLLAAFASEDKGIVDAVDS